MSSEPDAATLLARALGTAAPDAGRPGAASVAGASRVDLDPPTDLDLPADGDPTPRP